MDTPKENPNSFSSKVKSFDFWRKLPQDLSEKSSSGGFVSVICAIIIISLFLSEFSRLIKTNLRSEMVIDVQAANEAIQINLDITFFKVPCGLITIEGRDSLYASNEMKILKQRISKSLEPLLEYPPEHISSDRIDLAQMQVMITNEEGCRISGTMMAKKVTGYLYFNEKRMERERLAIKSVDFSHKITHFSFGNPSDLMTIQKQLNKLMSPLDDNVKEIKKGSPSTLFQYYLNVVPIKLVPQFGRTLFANQYTANSHKVDNFHKNNVVIRYDISPISVNYSVERESIAHFFVEISAIIGGIFTLSKVLDAWLYKMFKGRGDKADLEAIGTK